MIDLIYFFEQYNGNLSHHRAAINELMQAMPNELLDENADWVGIFEAAESEWGYTKIVEDCSIDSNK